MSEAPLAVLAGIALERLASVLPGSDGSDIRLNLVGVSADLSRLVLGIQLVLVGIQLPHTFLKAERRSMAALLLPVMGTAWLVTSALTMALFPSLSFLQALVIASCATPTDPVLSNAIVKGSFADHHVSPWLRSLISAESGANDGLAFPFLYLALSLLRSYSAAEAMRSWVLYTCLYQVMGAVVFGIVVGLSANRILRFSVQNNFIDKESFLCYGVAIGIFTTGLAGYLDLDDLFAAFVAGNALTYDDWYRKETEEDELHNVVDLLLNSAFFLFVGATIPWKAFMDLSGWRFVVLGLLVLLFRRLPALLLFHRLIPRLRGNLSDAAFMGYFGPIGAGAIFYANLVLEELHPDEEGLVGEHWGQQIEPLVKPIVYALVVASLLGHSALIPFVECFLSRRYKGAIKLLHSQRPLRAVEEALDNYEGSSSEEPSGSAAHRTTAHDPVEEQEAQAEGREPVEPVSRARPDTLSAHGGALSFDGQWNSHASWRHSTSHMPRSQQAPN